jgi:acyl-CoA synthetase (AMP-forming)/AMP-acid ligase II
MPSFLTAPIVSVSETVRRWAEREPERVCLSFHAAEGAAESVTYADLAHQAFVHACLFRAHGLRPADAVVLFARSTPGFVAAFLGAQEAGLLAVPCPPPEPLESARRVRERVREIFTRCRARALLDPVPMPLDAELASALAGAGVAVLAPPALVRADPAPSGAPDAGGFSLAYCQFTSGSGGRARGVLLSHESVAANILAMARAYSLSPDEVLVTWLPLFHDMGLVAYVLMPLALGYAAHVMSPLAFIARPVSWLALISQVRGTMASAPNFAYALCARKVSDAELAVLDLSTWRLAFNGSEPVTKSAVEVFSRRFAPCGFQPSALLPCYGLAEDTLCATSRRPGEGARFEQVSRLGLELEGTARLEPGGISVASVGRPLPGHEIFVIGPEGRVVADRRIGEVVIRGESLMRGYLPGTEGDPALSPDGSLFTGDLGYLADGELFLVGRKKDLIIRAGRNHYPQDIEEALAAVPGIRPGRAVAFSVPGSESERIVIAAELGHEQGGTSALQTTIRDAVFGATGLFPDEVLLLPRNALPLTSSGKVMRPEARRLYLEGRWVAA